MVAKQKKPTPAGQTPGKNILVIASTIVAAAILIIVILTFIFGTQTPNKADITLPFIPPIERDRPAAPPPDRTESEELSFRGTVVSVSEDTVTIFDQNENNNSSFALLHNTTFAYRGGSFSKENLRTGDFIKIRAKKAPGPAVAVHVEIVVATSPAIPAPVPDATKVDVRPDGTIKPLGGG